MQGRQVHFIYTSCHRTEIVRGINKDDAARVAVLGMSSTTLADTICRFLPSKHMFVVGASLLAIRQFVGKKVAFANDRRSLALPGMVICR